MFSRYLCLFIGLLIMGFATAETTRRSGDVGQAALLQVQAQAQQIAAERDTLRAENAKLQEELDALKKDTTRLKADKSVLQQRMNATEGTVSRFKDANSEAADRLRDTQGRMDKLVEKYKELVGQLKEMETEKLRLQNTTDLRSTQLTTQSAQLDSCAGDNLALYQLNLELLQQYRDKGVWDALKQREPVMGLGRVELENKVERYRIRLNQERLAGAAAAP
ncbi:MAG: hypothetical protein AABZ84_04495 [Pseudomonadota bacterium]